MTDGEFSMTLSQTNIKGSMGRAPIEIKCPKRNKVVPRFLIAAALLSLASLVYLDVNWGKLASRLPEVGTVFFELSRFNFANLDLILSSLAQTLCIAVLSLIYSIILGVFFGMLAAKNILKRPCLAAFTQAFFSFLRAVPTPVWVLLMLVCLGMGPEAGVAGLCVHTAAFFTKCFAQSFESIPDETLEALETAGAGRVSIFFNAVLPSALSQLVAWCGMRLEINFAECTILGMVGAGGVGYVISSSLQGYDFGTAGLAICLVFVTALTIERLFVKIKKSFAK